MVVLSLSFNGTKVLRLLIRRGMLYAVILHIMLIFVIVSLYRTSRTNPGEIPSVFSFSIV